MNLIISANIPEANQSPRSTLLHDLIDLATVEVILAGCVFLVECSTHHFREILLFI